MARNKLGIFEQELLGALMRRQHQNYALVIADTIAEHTGRQPPSLGAVHTALERMIKKGFVSSYWGEPDPARRNRRLRHYKIEAPGMEAWSKSGAAAVSQPSELGGEVGALT